MLLYGSMWLLAQTKKWAKQHLHFIKDVLPCPWPIWSKLIKLNSQQVTFPDHFVCTEKNIDLFCLLWKHLNVGPKTPEKFKMETWTIAWRGAYILTILLLGCRHFRNHLLKSPIESCSFGCFICGWIQVQLYGISLLLDSMSVKSLLHERSLVKSWNTEKYKIQLLYLKGF